MYSCHPDHSHSPAFPESVGAGVFDRNGGKDGVQANENGVNGSEGCLLRAA